MYKLGFLTLILSGVTAQQVICDDHGVNGTCVATTVVCDDSNKCVATTVVCDDYGVDGSCVTSTVDSKPTSTLDAKQGSISSYGEKNSVMNIFGLLPLLLL
jgi:hypothetical protein